MTTFSKTLGWGGSLLLANFPPNTEVTLVRYRLNRTRRRFVVKDFPSDLRLVIHTLPPETEFFDWRRSFPAGERNIRNVGRIHCLAIGRLGQFGVAANLINPFLTPLLEAVSNAIQHGRAETQCSIHIVLRRSPDWFVITVSVFNRLPPWRKVAEPVPKLRKLGKRNRGAGIMASELSDYYAVEVRNGDFYRVILTKLVGRTQPLL